MSEKAKDNFEKGIFWESYLDLERQFQNFLEYVPYLEGNENVYSFRLLNLILSIGGHVDSAFKEMARYSGFSKNDDCRKILDLLKKSEENVKVGTNFIPVRIKDCLKAFETECNLSKKEIVFKRLPERESIIPFKQHNPKTNAPEWWDIYNGLKHDVSLNLEKASLKNTRNALAGAFLLNVIHKPAALRLYEQGILKLDLLVPEADRLADDFGMSVEEFHYLRFDNHTFLSILENLSDYNYLYPSVETFVFTYDFWRNRHE